MITIQTTLIIFAICIFGSIMIAHLPLWVYLAHRKNKKTYKPFDCSYCLSGWMSLIITIIVGYEWYECIAIFFTIPFITAMFEYFISNMRGI